MRAEHDRTFEQTGNPQIIRIKASVDVHNVWSERSKLSMRTVRNTSQRKAIELQRPSGLPLEHGHPTTPARGAIERWGGRPGRDYDDLCSEPDLICRKAENGT